MAAQVDGIIWKKTIDMECDKLLALGLNNHDSISFDPYCRSDAGMRAITPSLWYVVHAVMTD